MGGAGRELNILCLHLEGNGEHLLLKDQAVTIQENVYYYVLNRFIHLKDIVTGKKSKLPSQAPSGSSTSVARAHAPGACSADFLVSLARSCIGSGTGSPVGCWHHLSACHMDVSKPQKQLN